MRSLVTCCNILPPILSPFRLFDRFHFRTSELGVYVGRRDTHRRVTNQRLDWHQSRGDDAIGHDNIDIQRHQSFSTW